MSSVPSSSLVLSSDPARATSSTNLGSRLSLTRMVNRFRKSALGPSASALEILLQTSPLEVMPPSIYPSAEAGTQTEEDANGEVNLFKQQIAKLSNENMALKDEVEDLKSKLAKVSFPPRVDSLVDSRLFRHRSYNSRSSYIAPRLSSLAESRPFSSAPLGYDYVPVGRQTRSGGRVFSGEGLVPLRLIPEVRSKKAESS